jgi:hypothetical protein
LKFGNLIFLFFSAEVLSGYEALLTSKNHKLIYIGYEGNCFGYLPTHQNILDGGYEASEFKSYFDVSGDFKSTIEETIKTSTWKVLNN